MSKAGKGGGAEAVLIACRQRDWHCRARALRKQAPTHLCDQGHIMQHLLLLRCSLRFDLQRVKHDTPPSKKKDQQVKSR